MSTYLTKRANEFGLKKEDATRPLIVSVNKTDISRASVKNPEACALARACKRQHNGVKAAYFFRSAAWLEYDDKIVRYQLPQSVQKEIVAFDRSKSMEPGNYKLTPPAPTRTLVYEASRFKDGDHNKHRKDGKKDGSSGLKRGLVHKTTNVRSLFVPA